MVLARRTGLCISDGSNKCTRGKFHTFFLTRRQASQPLLDGTPGISIYMDRRNVLRKTAIRKKFKGIRSRKQDRTLPRFTGRCDVLYAVRQEVDNDNDFACSQQYHGVKAMLSANFEPF